MSKEIEAKLAERLRRLADTYRESADNHRRSQNRLVTLEDACLLIAGLLDEIAEL